MSRRKMKRSRLKRKPQKGFAKRIVVGIGAIIILLICAFVFLRATNTNQRGNGTPLVLNQAALSSSGSSIVASKDTVIYSLQGYNGTLFQTKQKGVNAAWEFINNTPLYNSTGLLPSNFAKQAVLARGVKDSDDPFMQKNNIQSTSEHYFFEQKIQGTQVYGAKVAIHLRQGNQIYSVEGNLALNAQVGKRKISDKEAKTIALEKAKRDAGTNAKLTVVETNPSIINKKVLMVSTDETNYLTLAYLIKAQNGRAPFMKQYFVDLTTGTIVYELEKIHYALQRDIKCNGGNCTAGRKEGEPAVGNSIDSLYDWAGEYYNYFFTNFQRDSLDGNGQTMVGELLPAGQQTAQYGDGSMHLGEDMVFKNVVMHEFTHGVTEATSKLDGNVGAETLNEGMSDVFGEAITKDWSQSVPATGEIRNAQNPLGPGNADQIFSDKWMCTGDPFDMEHKNSNVESHAVYLMYQGGNKNNCAIDPMGDDVYKVVYQAETKYLNSTSNYQGFYTAMTNACNDLFQEGSVKCNTVKAALVTTQIDQFPADGVASPICNGGTAKEIVCPGPSPSAASGPSGPGPTFVCGGSTSSICPSPSSSVPGGTIGVSNPPNAVPSSAQPSMPATNGNVLPSISPNANPLGGLPLGGDQGGDKKGLFQKLIAFIVLLFLLFMGMF